MEEKICLNCKCTIQTRALKFCNNKCQAEYRYNSYIIRWKSGLEDGVVGLSISKFIRKYLFEKFNYKCSKCNWSEVNKFSGKIPLEVDHMDGNYKNNKESNLNLLCPNCHSLTPNYKRLNKKGRSSR